MTPVPSTPQDPAKDWPPPVSVPTTPFTLSQAWPLVLCAHTCVRGYVLASAYTCIFFPPRLQLLKRRHGASCIISSILRHDFLDTVPTLKLLLCISVGQGVSFLEVHKIMVGWTISWIFSSTKGDASDSLQVPAQVFDLEGDCRNSEDCPMNGCASRGPARRRFWLYESPHHRHGSFHSLPFLLKQKAKRLSA